MSRYLMNPMESVSDEHPIREEASHSNLDTAMFIEISHQVSQVPGGGWWWDGNAILKLGVYRMRKWREQGK